MRTINYTATAVQGDITADATLHARERVVFQNGGDDTVTIYDTYPTVDVIVAVLDPKQSSLPFFITDSFVYVYDGNYRTTKRLNDFEAVSNSGSQALIVTYI
jgi:hypothetical protein